MLNFVSDIYFKLPKLFYGQKPKYFTNFSLIAFPITITSIGSQNVY